MKFNHIRIVLVEPVHPGNIGMAARAMKNMGLSKLYLVNPKKFPDNEAVYRASRADDIVHGAVVVSSLKEAVKECRVVFGVSARERIMSQTMLDVRQTAELIANEFSEQEVALVFGCETSGLSNEDLALCHYQTQIPSNPEYSSLNLAAAVQVVTYELHMAQLTKNPIFKAEKSLSVPLATHEELQGLYDHLEATLIDTGFLHEDNPRKIMPRFRQIFNRAHLDREDVNLLRGVLSRIQKKIAG